MLDRLLGEQLLDLIDGLEELEGRLDDAVEQEGKVHQQREAEDLEPLERLPTQAEGHDPDEKGPASVDSRARCSADLLGDVEAEEVESTAP